MNRKKFYVVLFYFLIAGCTGAHSSNNSQWYIPPELTGMDTIVIGKHIKLLPNYHELTPNEEDWPFLEGFFKATPKIDLFNCNVQYNCTKDSILDAVVFSFEKTRPLVQDIYSRFHSPRSSVHMHYILRQ